MIISRELRDFIEVYKPTETMDEYKETIEEYVLYRKIKAVVYYTGGSKSNIEDQIEATNTMKFKIRRAKDLNEDMRILYAGKYYNITFLQPTRFETWIYATKILK